MKFRGIKIILAASLISLLAAPSFAKGKAKSKEKESNAMEFSEQSAVTSPSGTSPVAWILEEGKKLYNEGKFFEASQRLYQVTQSTDPNAVIDKNEAQYWLAKTLFKLKLYQSSLNYYRTIVDVGETHPFFDRSLNGLIELVDEISEDNKLIELLSAYVNRWPQDIPKKYQDRFAFLVGRYMDQTDPEKAIAMLTSVSQASPDYAKAQYIAGVSNVSLYNANDAVKNFKNSLRVLSEKRAKKQISYDEKRLLELGYLALGRVYYSTGQFDTSLKYYNRIDRRSENWPVALFESSWAYFQLDQYNKALGNLQSLNSPFFSDRFFPEGPILAGVLYFYNCRYDRVRGILDDFAFDYEPLQKEVQKIIDRYYTKGSEDLLGAFRWLINIRTAKLEDNQMNKVVLAALSDKQIQNKLKLLIAMKDELETLDKLPIDFRESEFGKFIKDATEADRLNTRFDIGTLAIERLSRVNDKLRDLIIEQKKILVEVERAERGEIESDLRAQLSVAVDAAEAPDIETTSEQLVWTFDGEYWRDELGYYVVSSPSQCKR